MTHLLRGNLRRVFTAAVALLTLLGAARSAMASGYEEDGVARQRVVYTDLNLDRTGDAARLYARLERAADHVCYADLSPYTEINIARRACARHALEDAVARVANPNLTAVHEARQAAGTHIVARR
jgi:UrcA family protein